MRYPAALLLAVAVAAAPLAAQDAQEHSTAYPEVREGNLGVGLQLTWPTYGLSGMFDVSDNISVQGVVGTAGYGLALTGRGLYRLARQELFRPYAYGEAGMWTGYGGWGTVPNFGAGAGVEVDIRQFIVDGPPIYAAFEAGLNMTIYSDSFLGSGSFTRFQMGPSVHYRF